MGERLTKKNNLETRESISFSTTTNSAIEDDILSDKQKLWDYIRQKRNSNKKVDLNLIDILTQGLRSDVDIHIEKRKSSGNFQQNDKEEEKIKKNDCEKNETENKSSKFDKSKYSPGRKKISSIQNSKLKYSPSKRNNTSNLRRNTRSLGKRVLLKEFEKTVVSEKQFEKTVVSEKQFNRQLYIKQNASSTPIVHNAKIGNVLANDDSTLDQTSFLPSKNNVEINLQVNNQKKPDENDNFDKNKTIVSEDSMEVSLGCWNKNRNQSNQVEGCFVRMTRLQKKRCENENRKLVGDRKQNESKNANKKTSEKVQKNITQNINKSFTVIPSTQEELQEKNNEKSNNESTLIIPETQEQNEKTYYNKVISISDSFTEDCDTNTEIVIKNENLEEIDIPAVSNNENLCISRNDLNTNKSKEDVAKENIDIIDDVDDEIIDIVEEIIDTMNSNNAENSLLNEKPSPKRNTHINENGASPSKQRRTYTIIRKSSNTESANINNIEIEAEQHHEDICENNEFEIEQNTEKNVTKPAQEQQWIVTKFLNSPRNSYDISKITSNPTSTKKTNWTSKIPQIKRTGNLTPMRPLTTTPFKVSDKTELPIIVSVQSLATKTNSNNQSNLNKENINETFNKNNLTSRLDKIIDAVQNSIIPKSPVVIMIDNNRNKNNDSIKSQSNTNSTLPMPPPEFSDSYQNKSKNISVPLKRINVSSKADKKNRTNYLISEDESNEPLEELDDNTDKITDDSGLAENNTLEKDKRISKNPVVNASVNKPKIFTIKEKISKTPTKSNVIDYSLKAEKLKSLNSTSNNNSKIFVAENFSVQPVDLRKSKSRRSSTIAQFRINAINELKSMKKNTSEEDFNKALEEYRIKYNTNCSKLDKGTSKLYPKENEQNMQTNSDVPLVTVFRENECYQSFTEVLNKNDKKKRESRNSISNLPAPPSFLLHSDIDQTEEFIEENPEYSSLRLREQTSRENSNFPNPPSFLLTNEMDLTLPINVTNNINCPKPTSSSNRRLSRFYQFQVQNEKNKNKRSVSTKDTLDVNQQEKCRELERQPELVEFINPSNSESNNTQEFPLPPAEAYDRPNEIVIEIPQNQESSSGYISSYFPASKRKKSVKSRCNANGDSSSSDSPEPKRVFRKQYRSIKKAKSMPSLKQKLSDDFHKEGNSGGDNSFSSTSRTDSQDVVGIQQQIDDDSDHVYDEPEVITHLWKESIKKKSDEAKKNDLTKNKKGRPRKQKNVDTLKETYLNITKNLPLNDLTHSFNKTNDGHRRKLYEKGKSDNEDSFNENKKKSLENLEAVSSFSHDVGNNKSNIQQKKSNIFSNVNQSVINSNDDDAIFKKPSLPAPKSNKSKLTKNIKSSSLNNSKNDTDKENTSKNNQNTIQNKRNNTKNGFKSEAEKLLENLPRSYKVPLNSYENNESTISSNIRKSGRKPAPRRIYKYSTNEYEILPSMNEYNKIMKEFYNYPVSKQKKNQKKSESRLANKNNLKDSKIDNKKQKVDRHKKKKIINEIIQEDEQQENDLNNQNIVSSDLVEGVEIENTHHFAEKQKNTTKPKPKSKIKNNGISLMSEQQNTSNNSLVISKKKDISQLVDTLKVSFNKFETTVLANMGSSKNNRNAEKQNPSNENKSTEKTLSNEKLKSKKAVKLKGKKNTLKEYDINDLIATKENDFNAKSNKITENDDNISNNSKQSTKSSSAECYDLFHWVKELACASTKINSNSSKNSSKDDDDIQRYFAENSFRITDISKMEISEKNGVQYAFYKEERSKDFGYIKFKPGSQKPRIRSKTFDLHFLFMFGVLEFHIDGEVYNSKAGNFVSIPKGTFYSIVNNSAEAACLFFIKVCSNSNNST